MRGLRDLDWVGIIGLSIACYLVGVLPLVVREAAALDTHLEQTRDPECAVYAYNMMYGAVQRWRGASTEIAHITGADVEAMVKAGTKGDDKLYFNTDGLNELEIARYDAAMLEGWQAMSSWIADHPNGELPDQQATFNNFVTYCRGMKNQSDAGSLRRVKSQQLRCDHAKEVAHSMARDIEYGFVPESFPNEFERQTFERVLSCRKDPKQRAGPALERCVVDKCMGVRA